MLGTLQKSELLSSKTPNTFSSYFNEKKHHCFATCNAKLMVTKWPKTVQTYGGTEMCFLFRALWSILVLLLINKPGLQALGCRWEGKPELSFCLLSSCQRMVQATQRRSFVLSPISMNVSKRQSECEHYELSKTNSADVRSQYFLCVAQG